MTKVWGGGPLDPPLGYLQQARLTYEYITVEVCCQFLDKTFLHTGFVVMGC